LLLSAGTHKMESSALLGAVVCQVPKKYRASARDSCLQCESGKDVLWQV
jgi:hypothetical protein